MWSAFARRLRKGSVSRDEYTAICDLFAEDRQNLYRFVPVNETAIRSACDYVEQYPLRASTQSTSQRRSTPIANS
jgi:hypothetical protein